MFNISDDNELKSLVLWLEDQKIRHYKVDDRDGLRDLTSVVWPLTYKKYLDDLACPVKSNQVGEEIEWLLGLAVRLEHNDNSEKYKNETARPISNYLVNVPKVVSVNSLDNLDFYSPDFVEGVNTLASKLKIMSHPDHIITLQAVCKIIRSRLSQEALSSPSSVIVEVSIKLFYHTIHTSCDALQHLYAFHFLLLCSLLPQIHLLHNRALKYYFRVLS